MEIVPQVLVIVLEASALAWSALAHTVDSNGVEGRLCTLNHKRIPQNWSTWLSQPSNALGYVTTSWNHIYILTFLKYMTRHRTAMIDLKVQEPLRHPHKPASLVLRHRYLNHSVNHHSKHHYIDTMNPPHHHPSIAFPTYDLPPKSLLTRAWRLHYSCITTGYTRIGVSGFLGPI